MKDTTLQNTDERTMHHDNTGDLVSVIMPTYNAARYVAKSIDSIRHQTYKHWELIITDDCSTDGTREILKSYAKRDKRIRIFFNETNQGAGCTRTNCIMNSVGRYVAFCDSDDRWTPNKLKVQVAFMKSTGTALCFSPYYTCDEHDNYLGYVPAPKSVTLNSMMYDNKIGFLTCIYDTEACGRPPIPPQRRRQDYAYILILLQRCKKAQSVQEVLGHYRIHTEGISHNKWKLIHYNVKTYHVVFGWNYFRSYLFFTFCFIPTYFWKRIYNLWVNINRTQLR